MENNKLIAEFMGFQETSIGWYDADSCLYENDNTFDTLRFDVDWNWLMPVVEKIESLNYSLEINKQEELDYQCLITKGNNIVIQKFNPIKIKAVYQAVVEFINQLNNN